MGAIFEFIAEVLNRFLPEPWNAHAGQGLLLLTVCIGFYIVIKFYLMRHKVYIKAFIVPDNQTHLNGLKLARELSRKIKYIQSVHSEDTTASTRCTASIGHLRHVSEDLQNNFDTVINAAAEINPVTNLILYVISRFFAPLEIHGNIHIHNEQVDYIVQVMKRGKQVALCMADGKLNQPETISYGIDILAYKIVLEMSEKSLINKNLSIGTQSWKAFEALTEALHFWQSEAFDIHKAESVKLVEAMLADSINHDHDYVIAYYNKGVLAYTTYKDMQSNEVARDYFQEALKRVRPTHIPYGLPGGTGDRRLEALALLGLSRCYSQLRHRYGNLDSTIVDKAREAAQAAVRLLGNDAQALYTLAFAWHCTETFDDICEGRRIYEQIIKKAPNKYSSVHNNLGYILMVGGKLLQEAGEKCKAEEWFNAAQLHMEVVVTRAKPSSRTIDFTHANLGNLYRLRGDYQRAIESYQKALHFDPEHSTYTNGLNELSLVYLTMGDIASAMHYHRLALRSTQDRSHLLKLMRQVADTLRDNNHPLNNAVKRLYEKVSETENPLDMMMWLGQVEALLTPGSLQDTFHPPTPAVISSASRLAECCSETQTVVAG